MADMLLFPDRESFQRAVGVLEATGASFEVLDPPEFCWELVPPAIRVSGGVGRLATELRSRNVPLSGAVPWGPFTREVPVARAADSQWKSILGTLRIVSIRPSLTDPSKLRFEAAPEKSLASLIPLMARLIRGGAYRFEIPVFAFEEEHRLLALSAHQLVICRADDVLDGWIMLRSLVELIVSAWNRRFDLEPEIAPRSGIGAIEIFRRLPGDNCKICKHENCMEFAMRLFMGRCHMEQCIPLFQREDTTGRESLTWLMSAIGLQGGRPTPSYVTPEPRELEHDTRPCALPQPSPAGAPRDCR